MIIRGTPKNIDLFVLVDDDTTKVLALEGFFADYIDSSGVYYKRTKDLLEFMDKNNLKSIDISI